MMQPPGSRGGYVPIPNGSRAGGPPMHRPPPSSTMQQQKQKQVLMEEAIPAETEEEASVEVVAQEESSQVTVGIVIISLLAYACLTTAVHLLCPADDEAVAVHSREVPPLVYQMSATAFFTSFVLNLTSFLFEDSSSKRQLALLSCTIKGAACYADLLLVTAKPLVLFDQHGALFVPSRYVQWAITTPLMVYILSKISDFTPRRTAMAAGADFIIVVSGFLAHLCPAPYHWFFFALSCCLFVYLMYELGMMVLSAIRASTGSSSANAQRSLVFIYLCTLVIWNMFPVFWLVNYFQPQYTLRNEVLVLFANFTAKVLFSSSIMYGNYMTIEQRRLLAKAAEEAARRIQMVTELKEAVTRKDQFMSLMSHELRTPLNGIIQLSDALCRGAGGALNEKGAHFMTTIKNSSNHLLNIINDILDVAALKEGKLAIKHECVDLAKAVGHVVDIVSPLAKKEVRIEQRVEPNTPLVVADFSRMVQVLYNLMGNALKFTKSGYVRVTVAPKDHTGAQVVMRVEDTGIGIAKAKIPTIWGAFEQVDMSVTRKFGGTGLGLNIVQQLVTSHEGTITCESKEGVGTCFTIILPVLQRNSRPSLEEQVRSSALSLGYSWDALVRAIPGGRSPSNVGNSARNSSITAYQAAPQSPSMDRYPSARVGAQNSRHSMEMQGYTTINNPLAASRNSMMSGGLEASMPPHQSERLLRQRTDELEREAMMNDLARRTEVKRSIDKSTTYYNPASDRHSTSGHHIPTGGGGGGGIHGPGAAYAASGSTNYTSHDAGMVATAVAGAEAMCGLNGTPHSHVAPGQGGVWAGHSERKPMHPRLTSLAQTGGMAAQRARTEPGTEPGMEEDMGMVMNSGRGGRGGPMSMGGGFSTPGGGNMRSGAGERPPPPAMRGRGAPPAWSAPFGDEDGFGNSGMMHHESQSAPLYGAGAMQSHGTPNRLGPSSCGTPPGAIGGNAPHGLSLDKLAYSNMYGQVQILSVDDEEVNQIVLEEILTSAGYQYARAMDGAEALDWLESQQTLPDLILLDCMMPNMSGHEFCGVLRQYIPSSVLPVIMVSAKSDNENIVEGLRSGSNDFVRKPYQREELLARIETQLRLKNDSWWLAELMNNQDGRENESMKLLKNILPEGIITRMQAGQKFVADSHSHVVVLFSDIVGFTNLSSKLPTAEVFLMLSNMFNAFDKLTDRFGVYKVETIGDAYMVAAGHDEDPSKAAKGTPVERVLSMARGMLDVVQHTTAPNGEKLKIRIGIHCGPAFAGVIGSKCPRYCFLGDTVNTAARMESLSFPMCVQVTANLVEQWSSGRPEDTVRLGERMVKGKGLMTTYLLKYGEWEEGKRLYEQQLAQSLNAPNTQGQMNMFMETGSINMSLSEPSTATAAIAAARTTELPDFAKLAAAGASRSAETEAEMDSLRDQLASTKGQLTALKEQLAAVKEHLSSTQDQLAMTKEQLASSKEELSAAKEKLTKEQMAHELLQKEQLTREQLLKEQLTKEELIPTAINLDTRTASSAGAHTESGSEAARLRVELAAAKELLATASVKLDKSQAQVAFAEQAREVALQEVAVARQQADMERQRATSALEKVTRVRTIVAQLNAQRSALSTAYPDSATNNPTAALAATLNSSSTTALFAPHFLSPADKAALLAGPDAELSQTTPTLHVTPSQQLVNATHAKNSLLMLKPHYQRYFTASPGQLSPGSSLQDMSHTSLLHQSGGGIKAVHAGSGRQSLLSGGLNTDKYLVSSAGPMLPAISIASVLEDLGFSAYAPRFRSEAVTLDQLLELDIGGLQALGMAPLGHCLRLRSVICDLAGMLLRACEERAAAVVVCEEQTPAAEKVLGNEGIGTST